jgi:hypothetical protein
MLSQVEAPQPQTAVVNAADTPNTVTIATTPDPTALTVSFEVTTPDSGVHVDPVIKSRLWVSPGAYELQFELQSDGGPKFGNPGITLNTPFGVISASPDLSRASVTLSNTNVLLPAMGSQIYPFSMMISDKVYDPSIVNTPDPV